MPAQTGCKSETGAILGPIVEHYLGELDLHARYLDDGKTAFLFLTRAGARILNAYRLYLEHRGARLPSNTSLFWSSRLLTCKGISSLRRDLAINTIGAEFVRLSLQQTVSAIFASGGPRDAVSTRQNLPAQPLHEFIDAEHPTAAALRKYLAEQSSLFTEYLNKTIGSAKRVVLVDTGWNGTVQRLLAASFPRIEWIGLYFGLTIEPGSWEAGRYGAAHGLIFESAAYRPDTPCTALTIHRHLIESLFEPNAPSIEHLERESASGVVTAPAGAQIVNETFDVISDPLYAGVLEYLEEGASRGPGAALALYHQSLLLLAEKLAYPTRADVDLFEGKPRSADFGRELRVPVLLRGNDRPPGEAAKERIARSLWPQGQIALEYAPQTARRQQSLLAPSPDSRPLRLAPARPFAPQGRVAIITRTKDRPLLLRRAAASVASQTYIDYVWVVVNDGGDRDEVLSVLQDSAVPPHQIAFCSSDKSVGMEAASNLGIRASSSELIVIHDDDDGWQPRFLEKAVQFLDSESGDKYGGVVTHSTYVSEEIVDGLIVEWGRWPYQDWVQHVQLSELIVENFFPPIAFLFRRSVSEAVGNFDEKLPVLGDWDFNIRFLIHSDIGVLPESLASYHHRDRGESGVYSNSVIGGISKHVEFNAILRNKFIRGAATNPAWAPAAALLAQGYALRDLRHRLSNSSRQATQLMQANAGNPEAMAAADQRWCMIEVIRHQRRGLWRLLAAFRSMPNEAALASRIARTPLRPPTDFDDAGYLGRYADVAQAVATGKFASGYDHYIKFGRAEGRIRPHPNRPNPN